MKDGLIYLFNNKVKEQVVFQIAPSQAVAVCEEPGHDGVGVEGSQAT